MCTAITYKSTSHYFGRNLDLDHSYDESVAITPRNRPLHFRYESEEPHHYAMIGIACIQNDHPLYYDAVNEHGLAIAALNFPGFAAYQKPAKDATNLASFELLPWLLATCKTTAEARTKLASIRVTDDAFSPSLPPNPLHWLIADLHDALVVEPQKDGLKLYDCPVGVLTNAPAFPYHLYRLNEYRNLTPKETPRGTFSETLSQEKFCLGLGAVGLPGDLSSVSRFVRAAYTKLNALPAEDETENVSQFFHILNSVAQVSGTVRLENGRHEKTIYSSCCNQEHGIYYYRTYENSQITAIHLHWENLETQTLYSYPLIRKEQICFGN